MHWQVEECRSEPLRTMSVPGPKRTSRPRRGMSAFGGMLGQLRGHLVPARVDNHDKADAPNARDRRDIANEIEVEIVVEGRVIRVRVSDCEQRVAVGGRTHDGLGRDIAASTWSVLNEEFLAEPFRQPLTDQPCRRVSEATGRKASDNAHRPGRIGLRPGDAVQCPVLKSVDDGTDRFF